MTDGRAYTQSFMTETAFQTSIENIINLSSDLIEKMVEEIDYYQRGYNIS
jgi:hypothetical protein